MLLKDNKINYQKIDEDSYKIVSVEKNVPVLSVQQKMVKH